MNTTKISFLCLMITGLMSTSCTKDFDEINSDPNGFTTASDGSLFNGIIQSLVWTGNEQFYIYNEILYKQTQLAALTSEAWGNAPLGIEGLWENYYSTLTQIRELERRFNGKDTATPGLDNMKAMLKIVLACKTFKMTDMFGDMPFSEAGYGFQNLELLRPAYDRQRDIYLFLLEELKWADEHIDPADIKEPFATFATFDRLFNGDLMKWRKFANSLRLRHALRMSEKEPQAGGSVLKDIIENNKPVLTGYDLAVPLLESACLWPAAMGFKNEALNWSFREHKNLRMGSKLWQQLSLHDSTNGSGIFDPRAYIFFETNKDNQWKPYPQIPDAGTPPSGGNPYGEHRDDNANFSFKGDCLYSPFNYFLIRDENYVPIILITGAEVHFIKAEAWLRGIGVPADPSKADIEYMNGINASVDWWKMVAGNSKLPLSGISFSEKFTIPSNLGAASVLNQFGPWNASTTEEKLVFIYTQRWIDAFRQPAEAWALARRTGKTPRDGAPLNYFRLSYPASEATYNTQQWAAAIQQQGGSDAPQAKIWWVP
ncbi:MAG TPA: SusD/RagB family nutrient-binding outer membrane lipoprotein [Bacteroidales bacterium]|nr:SusD/RagB family nutrient-binding outer membrane lipoprotein [Bacteroidales bacterium]HSA44857.1 SusD/RagB family nutrient-binding outer membrane lipoprotein [Bacteroidales bacterium]